MFSVKGEAGSSEEEEASEFNETVLSEGERRFDVR
jgi:hypothetical protein